VLYTVKKSRIEGFFMSTKKFNNRGVYSLLLTPFNVDRSIDFETYEKYVEWQARQGADHLFACCGSSM